MKVWNSERCEQVTVRENRNAALKPRIQFGLRGFCMNPRHWREHSARPPRDDVLVPYFQAQEPLRTSGHAASCACFLYFPPVVKDSWQINPVFIIIKFNIKPVFSRMLLMLCAHLVRIWSAFNPHLSTTKPERVGIHPPV